MRCQFLSFVVKLTLGLAMCRYRNSYYKSFEKYTPRAWHIQTYSIQLTNIELLSLDTVPPWICSKFQNYSIFDLQLAFQMKLSNRISRRLSSLNEYMLPCHPVLFVSYCSQDCFYNKIVKRPMQTSLLIFPLFLTVACCKSFYIKTFQVLTY